LAALRGRDHDVNVTFTGHETWQDIVGGLSWIEKGYSGRCGALVVSVPTVPNEHRGQFERCINGDFDRHIRAFGSRLVAMGAGEAVVRLGYEANLRTFAWAITGDGRSWVGCFRRWVDLLREVPGQRFSFLWNPSSAGSWSHANNIANAYPGNGYVDYIGIDVYDRCPALRGQAAWDERYDKIGRSGSPIGVGAWLAFAKARGKKLSVPEWGIGGSQNCDGAGFDNPLFVRNMARFFREHAEDIAFEAVFNGGRPDDRNGYRLAPTSVHTRAAAAYRSDWR
jgi:hypothetical protein